MLFLVSSLPVSAYMYFCYETAVWQTSLVLSGPASNHTTLFSITASLAFLLNRLSPWFPIANNTITVLVRSLCITLENRWGLHLGLKMRTTFTEFTYHINLFNMLPIVNYNKHQQQFYVQKFTKIRCSTQQTRGMADGHIYSASFSIRMGEPWIWCIVMGVAGVYTSRS